MEVRVHEAAATTAGGILVFEALVTTDSAETVNAGPDVIGVEPWVGQVTLYGTSSSGIYQWTQMTGSTVTLSSTSVAEPTFTAPAGTMDGETLTFRLSNGAGVVDTVSVGILPTTFAVLTGSSWSPRRIVRLSGGQWV